MADIAVPQQDGIASLIATSFGLWLSMSILVIVHKARGDSSYSYSHAVFFRCMVGGKLELVHSLISHSGTSVEKITSFSVHFYHNPPNCTE